jgi:signal transduction histidine kinase
MVAGRGKQRTVQSGFVVDTHLLRELGDLLVGRDSTAILELVKNGYDADATIVRIEGHQLTDPDQGVLTVADNGNGMTLHRFRSAFLRIAGRTKETGTRSSPVFGRAYTGQKGIGRLASQKLANELDVTSSPNGRGAGNAGPGVRATIDWDEIDQQERLDQLDRGLKVAALSRQLPRRPGTTLTMRRLKRRWLPEEVALFVSELRTAQPPAVITGTDEELMPSDPLFRTPRTRTANKDDPGFSIEFGGELTAGDDLWSVAAKQFDWCVEIDVADGRTQYRISPTQLFQNANPLARRYDFTAAAAPNVRFQARFYTMSNASAKGPLGGFVRSQSGIRVYLEGFRVLPYGEYGDDWLGTDRDYRSGPRLYSIALDDAASDVVRSDQNEGLNATGSAGYYGAVFLTSAGAPDLESLINREGFVPSPTFQAIRDITRDGLRLSVRVRRSHYLQTTTLETARVAAPKAPEGDVRPAQEPVAEPTRPGDPLRSPYNVLADTRPSADARRTIENASIPATRISDAPDDTPDREDVDAVVHGFQAAQAALLSVQAIQPELRTLAGVGLQLGAFVHDINGMLASVAAVRELLASVIAEITDRKQRTRLQNVLRAAEDLAHVLARQSSYLTDVLSTDPRRRRSRVVVADRVDAVLAFLESRITEARLHVHIDIADGTRTPPMFPAEMMILLTNLLTNAVKNADANVWINGGVDAEGNTVLTISNDGAAVHLDESERWFLPFESTTTNVDEVLGQGLGLGLPIVRAITDDYAGDVRFVPPRPDAATSVQVWLKRKDR